MSNFNVEFKKILKNLEENVSDKESLEIAKVEMFNLYNLFFDEITNLEQSLNDKMVAIAETQLSMQEKLNNIDKAVKNIEKDIYDDTDFEEDEDYDVEVKCPYCNATFTAQMDELTAPEIVCPECSNTIELDWGEDDECGCGGCHGCGHDHHHHDEDDDM